MNNNSNQTAGLSAAEKRALLARLLKEKKPKPTQASQAHCLHQLFETQVEKTPNAVAVVMEEEQVNYQELNSRANQLAHQLRSLGVKPENCVGIYMEPSVELIVGLLGILKAGGAYLPLAPDYPEAYLTRLLAETNTPVVLTQPHLQARLPKLSSVQTHCLEPNGTASQSQDNPESGAMLDNLAYVLYSATQPIQVEHQAVAQRLAWLQNTFPLSESDVVLQKTPLMQDTAVWEIFWPLMTGGRLVLAGPEYKAAKLPHLIATHQVSLLHLVPSALSELVESLNTEPTTTKLNSLRWVFCSGEPLRQTVVDAFCQSKPIDQCDLQYFYSLPTAAGEITWQQHCQQGESNAIVALGRPTYRPIYVLDKYLQPVPWGAKGEIYVGGSGFARENLPVPSKLCPVSSSPCLVENPLKPGTQLLKTDDLGHQLNDGTIELLGSLNRLVWLSGYQVDLKVVETTLLAESSVDECVVLARETVTYHWQLVAYVVSGRFSPERLQDHLRSQLPAYMLPSAYVSLSSLPVTATGQVDESALTRLEVINTEVIQQWEQELQSLPEIDKVAVVLQHNHERLLPLHLSDLLPDWQSTATHAMPKAPSQTHQTVAESDSVPKVMAISDGGPLVIPDNAPNTLTEALIKTAAKFKDNGIFHIQPDGSAIFQSYASLLEEAKCILNGLTHKGIKPSDRVILQIEALTDHFATFWACILGGITPVTVAVAPRYDETNSVVNKLLNTWTLLEQPAILASSTLIESLTGLKQLLPTAESSVLSVQELRNHPPTEHIYQSQPTDLVFFQLTSGSTGTPKCIQETHRGIICHIHASTQVNHYQPEDISLNWLSMDHVVPLLMYHIKDVYLGCQQVQAPTTLILSNPLKWLDLIEQYRVTHTWSPNFGYKMVSEQLSKVPAKTWDLSSIKFFVNAGEQVTLPVVQDFLNRVAPFQVPVSAMQPAYGMAEISTVIVYENNFDFDRSIHYFDKSSLHGQLKKPENDEGVTVNFVDQGPPNPGIQIRVVDKDNQLLPEGVIGRLQVNGEVVTPGYLNNPVANQEAFVGEGWFNTGDLGFLLEGSLTITGREKEVIIIHGANFYCYEIEEVVNQIEGVEPTYVGACAVFEPNTGIEGLAIFFTPTEETLADNIKVIKKIRTQVTSNLGISPSYVIPVPQSEFPKTTSGKIQRTKLKQQFDTGNFQPVLKELDIFLNANTLPDWFYQPVWHSKLPGISVSQPPTGSYLIFLDSLGLGHDLCQRLAPHNTCISVEIGSTFSKLSATHYRIVPSESDHYQRLMTSLEADGIQIRHILHLWTYDEYIGPVASLNALQQAQTVGVYSLLWLVQALAKTQLAKHSCQLLLISSHIQPTSPTDKMAYQKSTVVGLLKTIPLELSWLQCRHIDLEIDAAEINAARVFQELCLLKGEPEVAYRGNQRLIPSLSKVDMRRPKKPEMPIKSGGIYLVTGGLGGIGVHLAQFLLEKYQAKLILVGRTVLPERETWSSHLELKTRLSKRLNHYLALEARGGEFIYQPVDICDFAGLQKVVTEAELTWNEPLSGIIHLAGDLGGEGTLLSHWETAEQHSVAMETQPIFETLLRPKVYGTWTLYQLIKNNASAVFITFSSVNGWFGGSTFSAYSAANSFLDCYSRYQQQQGHRNTYCFSWTMWDDLGMSQGSMTSNQTSSRATGYHLISKEQGLYSLIAGLSRPPALMMVGLDGSHPNIRKLTEKSVNLNQLTAYFTQRTNELPVSVSHLQSLEIPDIFGTPCHCDFVPLEKMPLSDRGEIDKNQLMIMGSHRTLPRSSHIAPRTNVERILVKIWQDVLNVSTVGIKDNLFELGGHSLLLVQIQSQLQERIGISVSTVEMFQYPTIQALAEHLTSQPSPQTAVQKKPLKNRHHRPASNEIAIIGMAGRFPKATDIETFWHNLRDGVESIEFFSEEELIASGVDSITQNQPNYVKAGTVLADVEWFDAQFFDLSPREAEVMDPQHRHFLECAWEALENAGYEAGTDEYTIGVYGGVDINTYLLNNLYPNRDSLSVEPYQVMIDSDKDYLPTRVSYKLNLTGPSVTIQTTCSTSLVAVHSACQSLFLGECDMALAGGVGIHAPQKTGYFYQEGMINSPDGHCRAFDAKAQGTVSGQGVGIVVLKRVADAIKDGDYIHAIIKGSAVNNDGAVKVGYTAPSVEGQAAVISQAQSAAGVEADTITYVEAHGTGTSLGDPIEIAALTQAFRASTQKKGFCAIGSVKTNIGHAGAAAGVAGLMKTVLALKHQLLPPSLNFEQPNPKIDFANSPFYLNSTLSEWQTNGTTPRRAGVSSFGVGGTNAHIIVEEAPPPKPSGTSRRWQLLVLSAKTPSALETATHHLATYLEQHPDSQLADVAYTLHKGRKAFNHRRMFVCQQSNDAIAALNATDPTHLLTSHVHTENRPIVFMFSGQGAQYINMGAELYRHEPIFQAQVNFCSEFLKPQLGFDLRDILYPNDTPIDEATQQLNQTAITQVALFVIEYALAQLWKAWGILPEAMIGHSIGEYVAACLAGVFSVEEALSLVATRGQLMQSMPSGAMLAVSLSESEVQSCLGNGVSLAAINGPSRCVISGSTANLDVLQSQLTEQRIECRRLHTSHAFHSEMMEPIMTAFTEKVKQVRLNPPQIPYLSNVTGTWMTAEAATDPNYYAQHLRQTVRFSDGLQVLLADSERILLEIGPGRTLKTLAKQHPDKAAEQLMLSSLRHPQDSQSDVAFLLNSLGQLWAVGSPINWSGFYANESRQRLPLPTYPFERQRYWIVPPPPIAIQSVTPAQSMWQSIIKAVHSQAEVSLSAMDDFISHYPTKRQWLDRLCLAYMNLALTGLGAFSHPNEKYSLATFGQQFSVDPRYQQLVSRWLTVLVEQRELLQEGENITQLRPLSTETFAAILEKAKQHWNNDAEWHEIQRFRDHFVPILRGEKEPREVFFPETGDTTLEEPDNLSKESLLYSHYNAIMQSCLQQVVKLLPTTVDLRVLEIGGGTGLTTQVLLPILSSKRTRYTFTDISQFFLTEAQQKFSAYPFVEYRLLDIGQSHQKQGYQKHSFDIVVATMMLHATKNVNEALQQVHSLLAPGGLLLFWEITKPLLDFELIHGFLMPPVNEAGRTPGNPFFSKQQWHDVLRANGFAEVQTFPDTEALEHHIFLAQAEQHTSAFTSLTKPTDLDETKPATVTHSRPELNQPYVAPRNDIEQKIVTIWQQVLNIANVGIDDNFFELGGDSLLTVPLSIKLRETFQKPLFPHHLLPAPTVAQLAELIEPNHLNAPRSAQQVQQSVPLPLVAISATGSKPPFFCIHPSGGNVFCYAKLATYLGSEQPFYGLQAKGLDGFDEPFSQIEEMAAYYINALQAVQPQGPYFLGGWSFGGIVAFEMAKQLLKLGEQVALLAIIDVGAPIYGYKKDTLEEGVLLSLFATEEFLVERNEEVPALLTNIRKLGPEEQLRFLLSKAKKTHFLPTTAEIQDIRPLVQIFKTNVQAMQRYEPQNPPLINRLVLFRAGELEKELLEVCFIDPIVPASGWDQFADEVEIYTLAGSHNTILTEPYVEHFAEQLRHCINKAPVN